jgi:hypothetical protein
MTESLHVIKHDKMPAPGMGELRRVIHPGECPHFPQQSQSVALGVCPSNAILLRHMICGSLRRSRPEKILHGIEYASGLFDLRPRIYQQLRAQCGALAVKAGRRLFPVGPRGRHIFTF